MNVRRTFSLSRVMTGPDRLKGPRLLRHDKLKFVGHQIQFANPASAISSNRIFLIPLYNGSISQFSVSA